MQNGGCTAEGCENQPSESCSYVDRRGRSCEPQWCSNHIEEFSGRPYCRRHVATLLAVSESANVGGIPDIDNRIPGLVRYVASGLDSEVRQMLTDVAPPDSKLLVDSVRLSLAPSHSRTRRRRWSASWKLISDTGVLCGVAIAIDEGGASEINARVDGHQVASVTPPWISSRGDEKANADFYGEMTRAIGVGIHNALASAN